MTSLRCLRSFGYLQVLRAVERGGRRGMTVLVAVGLLLLAGGCASVPEEDPPIEVTLADLRFTEATVFETMAVAEVRLANVSPSEVRVTGAAHKVVVNGRRLGRGLSSAEVTVPRLGTATQRVEFHLRNISMARTLHELAQARVVEYELDSTVYVAGPGGGDRTLRVQRSGQLDLSRLGARPAP